MFVVALPETIRSTESLPANGSTIVLDRERGVRVGGALELVAGLGVRPLPRRLLRRRRQQVDDRVEKRLEADALHGRAEEDGQELTGARALAEPRAELVGRELGPLEVLLEELVVRLGDRLDQLVARRRDLGGEVGRRLRLLHLLVLVDPGLAGEQVDDALEGGLVPDRDLQHGGLHAERLEVVERVLEARALAVESGDEPDAGEPQLVAPPQAPPRP
jgi:hypothetical protein